MPGSFDAWLLCGFFSEGKGGGTRHFNLWKMSRRDRGVVNTKSRSAHVQVSLTESHLHFMDNCVCGSSGFYLCDVNLHSAFIGSPVLYLTLIIFIFFLSTPLSMHNLSPPHYYYYYYQSDQYADAATNWPKHQNKEVNGPLNVCSQREVKLL